MITFRRASLACHQSCRSIAERPATRPFMRWRFDAANSGHGVRARPVRASTKMRTGDRAPQRNVNEIRSVQNTNHAPLPRCIKNNRIQRVAPQTDRATRYQPSGLPLHIWRPLRSRSRRSWRSSNGSKVGTTRIADTDLQSSANPKAGASAACGVRLPCGVRLEEVRPETKSKDKKVSTDGSDRLDPSRSIRPHHPVPPCPASR